MSGTPALRLRRRPRLVPQAEAADCALACLATIAGYHGHEVDLFALRARFGSPRGSSLPQLMHAAAALGLVTRAVRLEPEALPALRMPAILHWDLDHFVVLERASSRRAWILDPAAGARRWPLSELARHFTGVALELGPGDGFAPAQPAERLGLSPFFRSVRGLASSLAGLLLASLVLQAVALAGPFYGQLVIDEALASADTGLLAVLGAAAAVLLLLGTGIGALRSFLILRLGSRLQFEWAARLFHHLLRLPLAFFERRAASDVLSRFRSVHAIQHLVTTAVIEALIDGLMAATTLAVMLWYAPSLAILCLAALAGYALMRALTYASQRENARDLLARGAAETGHFLESVRAVAAIKAFGREPLRQAHWQEQAARAVEAGYRAGALRTLQQSASQLLFGLENVLVVGLGAQAVLDTRMTVGMLVAFLAYKAQFSQRAGALLDRWLEFRLASVHLDRLADIALSQREPGAAEARPAEPLQGALEVSGVRFRHAPGEPEVLGGLSLRVRAGECVAIVGPSGCGKSTLLKIMCGLLQPDEGVVTVDGRALEGPAVAGYRRQIGCVLQEDSLLAGSLADNIAFFDARPDPSRIEECARLACIHDDIQAMPMGYLTRVGDQGAALSGGQKQRLLLARALYARPRILFLDEATSHVDPATEQRIHEALGRMRMTRVMVAHRRETLAIADRVVRLAAAPASSGSPAMALA